jgi:S-formylglutathione hydrolase FrmB
VTAGAAAQAWRGGAGGARPGGGTRRPEQRAHELVQAVGGGAGVDGPQLAPEGDQGAAKGGQGAVASTLKRRSKGAYPAAVRRALALLVLAAVALGLLVAVATGADGQGALRVERVTIASEAIGRKLKLSLVVPPARGDGTRRGLVVFLHGRGGDDRSSLGPPLLAAVARLGDEAPALAFPDGGVDSYWHDRESGAWRRYVLREVIPRALRETGADPARIAIGGISMGGFGALDLARARPHRFCGVAGHSPAIWTSAGQTAPGAFDDAADFARHDVVRAARRGAYPADLPLWLDAGTRDPFRPGDRAFARAVRAAGGDLTFRTWPGGHDGNYWNAHWRSYLRFYVTALDAC